jgi:cytochrome c
MGQDRHCTQTYGTIGGMPRKAAILALAVAAVLFQTTAATPQQPSSSFRVLAFTKTAGFRHESIPAALQALRELGAGNGFTVDATEDPGEFTDANLARYAVVAFVLTTGDVLDDTRQAAFERYIRAGHGFVGVHSAADTEHDWPWYGRLVGAFFKSHPAIQPATVVVTDPRHLSTLGLPRRWSRTDEWYNFSSNPRPAVRVLATLDETTYSPGDGAMGGDHPIAWARELDGGRGWYTGGGHTEESYSEPLFRAHLVGGIRYAAGLAPPTILSVATTVRSRRVAVVLHVADCRPCTARLNVRRPGRTLAVPMRLGGGRARATTPALPAGRWTLVLTVENRANGRRAVVRRSVRIS